MAINHVARARRMWPRLVKRALSGADPFTYKELCVPMGLHWRAASWPLGVIQDYCRRNHLPPLQAFAVRKDSRVPGTGYVGSPRSIAAHRRAVQKVRKHGRQWSLTA